MTNQKPVLIPTHDDEREALTGDERDDLDLGVFLDLVVEIGLEEAKLHFSLWQDFLDSETGEFRVPLVDMQEVMVERGQARRTKPIIVLSGPDEADEDDLRERLKAMGIPNP